MKIKNEEELANVLGMAFRQFSAVVATGRNIQAFLPLLNEPHVAVVIKLKDSGEINIIPYSDRVHYMLKKPTVVYPEEVIEPIVVAEVETPITEETTITEPVLEAETEETMTEKPKRKRRTI